MKKLFSVLLAAAMTFSAMGVTAFAEDDDRDVMLDEFYLVDFNAKPVYALGKDISAYTPGDVNMDGVIDAKDANLISIEVNAYSILEMGHFLDEQQRQLADVNSIMSRGQVDSIGLGDAFLVLLYYNYTQVVGEYEAAAFYSAWNNGDRSLRQFLD